MLKKTFDTSNYELERSLPKGKKKLWFNERRIRQKNHKRVCRIKRKTYDYLTDDNDENKKAKTQKMYNKRKI